MVASNLPASNNVSFKMGCPQAPHSHFDNGLFYQDHPPSSTLRRDAVESCVMLPPVRKAQGDPSPSEDAAGRSSSPLLPIPTPRQPILAVTRSAFIPRPIILDRPLIPPQPPSPPVAPGPNRNETPIVSPRSRFASEVMEFPPLPRVPSPFPCPVAVSTPVQTPKAVVINPLYYTRPPSPVPVPVDLPEAVSPQVGCPKPVLSDIKPNGCTCLPQSYWNGKKWLVRTSLCKNCVPSDTGKLEAEDVGYSKDPVPTKARPESPIISRTAELYAMVFSILCVHAMTRSVQHWQTGSRQIVPRANSKRPGS